MTAPAVPARRCRLQVDDEHGTAAVVIDLPPLTQEVAAFLDSALGGLTEQQRLALLADLIRHEADALAYEREAQRRGVLAL